MTRSTFVRAVVAASILAAVGGVRAADEPPKLAAAPPPGSETASFFHSYLNPRMAARLGSERAAVDADFGSASVNPWTRNLETEDRIRRGAIRATKSALKRYAMERLNIDGWSLPLVSGRARGISAFRTESGGPRLRFGISHLTPKAEVLVPLGSGRVTFGADALGRVGTSYEMLGSTLRVSGSFDPKDHRAAAGLTFGF